MRALRAHVCVLFVLMYVRSSFIRYLAIVATVCLVGKYPTPGDLPLYLLCYCAQFSLRKMAINLHTVEADVKGYSQKLHNVAEGTIELFFFFLVRYGCMCSRICSEGK